MFVVRTWTEGPHDGVSLRGQIDHPVSGQRRYFSNFGDLCDFIASAHHPAEQASPPDVDGPETVPR